MFWISFKTYVVDTKYKSSVYKMTLLHGQLPVSTMQRGNQTTPTSLRISFLLQIAEVTFAGSSHNKVTTKIQLILTAVAMEILKWSTLKYIRNKAAMLR